MSDPIYALCKMSCFGDYRYYLVTVAGEEFSCGFEFPETASFFGNSISGPYEGEADLMVTKSMWETWTKTIGPRDTRNEYNAIAYCISEKLLLHGCCVIHAAAIRYNEEAYLITAPPGVGKSTQVKTLMELYPNEFEVISGDRPVIETKEEGVVVHPSPWNGKENWFGGMSAPLKAVIILSRGDNNSIIPLSARRSAAKLFAALFQTSEDEEMIKRSARIVESIIKNSAVYQMINGGVPDSSRMLYDKVFMGGRNEL